MYKKCLPLVRLFATASKSPTKNSIIIELLSIELLSFINRRVRRTFSFQMQTVAYRITIGGPLSEHGRSAVEYLNTPK